MKRMLGLICTFFLILLATSCSTQKVNNDISTTTFGSNSTSETNKVLSDSYPDIQVQSPITLSNTELNFNGQSAYLRLKMVKGRYYEDWNPGAYMGTLWEGSFVLDLADESGKTIAETDISKMFPEPLTFNSSFNIELDDYNNDGDSDLTIGQYGSSNGYVYKIFTLRKDGKVEELPVKDHSDLFISNRTANYSTKLNKINGTTFEIEYYDNSVPATFHDFYQWNGKEFVLSKSQKMTLEDALAGSLQDKNAEYTYIKYGKSEEGLMEFTRTGTQIKGYVEMANINKDNEVDIKKYPFTGTLVNNYISITFPEESWLNTKKGASWMGRFDYQGFDISLPVDSNVDPNGYTILTFNRGTIDDFNNNVAELKGRAQEWKREANVKPPEPVPSDTVNNVQTGVKTKHDYSKEAHLPPADWNPLKASDKELAYYKYPPRPTDSSKLTAWKKTVTGGWYNAETGSIPVHSHPCIPCEIVWNNRAYEVDGRCGPINGKESGKDNDGATVYEIPGVDSSYGIILGFGNFDGHRATRIDYKINDALASVFLDPGLLEDKLDSLDFPKSAVKIKSSVNLGGKTNGRAIPVELETNIAETGTLEYTVTFIETWDTADYNYDGCTQPVGKHYWRFKVVPNSYSDLDSGGDIPPQEAKN